MTCGMACRKSHSGLKSFRKLRDKALKVHIRAYLNAQLP